MYKDLFILQLGCGGTGARVARELFQQLWANRKPYTNHVYILADGAKVRKKNLPRQNFIEDDLNQSKARILLERYSQVFPITAYANTKYLENTESIKKMLAQCGYRMPVIITCVDNNRSRQLVHQVFFELNNIVWIDAGNGMDDGQAAMGIRKNGITIAPPSTELWPDILDDSDSFKSEAEGCSCADQPSAQTANANMLSATAIVLLFSQLLYGDQEYITQNWVAFNAPRIMMRAHQNTKIIKEEEYENIRHVS